MTSAARVACDAVWLEFMIDGEADYFIHIQGRVIEASHSRFKPVDTLELSLGNYEPLVAGLHVLGSRGAAAIIKTPEQIEAIRAYVVEATTTGKSLIADITVDTHGTPRAGGKAHSWTTCEAEFEVVDFALAYTPNADLTTPEDNATIRAELAPDPVSADNSASGPLTLSGEVTTISGVEIDDFDALTLHLDPSATEGRLRLEGKRAVLTWPTPVSDTPHILAILGQAKASGRLLLDVDMGAEALDAAGTLWPLTDVSLLTPVLKAPVPAKRSAEPGSTDCA